MLNEHEYAISPATFYRFQARGFGPTPAEMDEAYTAHRLFELWRANRRVYGRRKLWKAAHRAGWNIGRDQVQRLMNILGIAGVLRRKTTRTTVADPTAERFPDRIQRAWSQAQRPISGGSRISRMCTPAAVSATWLLSPTGSPVRSWRMSWTPEPRHLWSSVRCDRHWRYASARTGTLSRPG